MLELPDTSRVPPTVEFPVDIEPVVIKFSLPKLTLSPVDDILSAIKLPDVVISPVILAAPKTVKSPDVLTLVEDIEPPTSKVNCGFVLLIPTLPSPVIFINSVPSPLFPPA